MGTKIVMRRIKDAKYFINKVIKENHSKDEWCSLRDEIKKWLKDAPTDQKDEFLKSGAAECLAMICVRL